MKKQGKWLVAAAAFLVLLAGAGVLYNRLNKSFAPEIAVEPPQTSQADKMMSVDFTVQDSEGNAVKLSDLYGKPIVLNFWASWCPPCKQEMPEFQEVYDEWGDDVQFMMVDLVGGQETQEKGAAYIAEQGFTFPVYYDTTQQAAYTYGIVSIPTTLFIDKDGYVVTGAQGAINKATLLKAIDLVTGE